MDHSMKRRAGVGRRKIMRHAPRAERAGGECEDYTERLVEAELAHRGAPPSRVEGAYGVEAEKALMGLAGPAP